MNETEFLMVKDKQISMGFWWGEEFSRDRCSNHNRRYKFNNFTTVTQFPPSKEKLPKQEYIYNTFGNICLHCIF